MTAVEETRALVPPERRKEPLAVRSGLRDDVAEEAVLGAVLVDDSVLPLVLGQISVEDFAVPGHAVVFAAMVSIVRAGQRVDYISLDHELRDRHRLQTVGGVQTLEEFTERLARLWYSTAHVETHARIVAERARRRRLHALATQLVSLTNDTRAQVDDVDRAVRGLLEASATRTDARLVSLGEAFVEVLDRFTSPEAASAGAVRTGFLDFDERTAGGLRAGQLVVIAARPSMGKTALALGLALYAAEEALARAAASATAPPRVLFISLEMSAGDLSLRAASLRGRFSAHAVRSGALPAEQMTAFLGMGAVLDPLPIRILDTGSLKLAALRALVLREALREGGLALVVIDYLQLVRADERSDSREREVSEVARGLKDVAMEARIPVVALSQLNRACEQRPGKQKRPMMSDLRESGEIEAAADVVTFLYRDEVYNKDTEDRGIAEWILGKQRNGPLGTVRLAWIAEHTRFDNLAADEPSEPYRVGGYRPSAAPASAGDEEVPW